MRKGVLACFYALVAALLIVAPVVLGVIDGAQAQTAGGGYPSRPRFQNVVVASAPAATYGQLSLRGNASGAANVALMSFADSTGARVGYIGDAAPGDDGIYLENSLTSGNIVLQTQTGGAVRIQGTTDVTIGGARVLTGRIAYGNFGVCSSGTCTPIGTPSLGVNWLTTGSYQIQLSGFSATPVCVVTSSANGTHAEVIPTTATSTTYNFVVKATTTNTDSGFAIHCIGT